MSGPELYIIQTFRRDPEDRWIVDAPSFGLDVARENAVNRLEQHHIDPKVIGKDKPHFARIMNVEGRVEAVFERRPEGVVEIFPSNH